MKDVICQGCNKPIRRRSELAVVGKTFLTYHRDCYARASLGTRFVHGYRINGPALWYILFLINGMMFGALFFLPNVKMDGEFKTILTLKELSDTYTSEELTLVRKGNRLSIMPINKNIALELLKKLKQN